eukprot:sb/3473009/
MFSCTLGCEGTALSILNVVGPAAVELRHHERPGGSDRGALRAAEEISVLDVQLDNVVTKLSYQDAVLFWNILDSVRRQSMETMSRQEGEGGEKGDGREGGGRALAGIEVKCREVGHGFLVRVSELCRQNGDSCENKNYGSNLDQFLGNFFHNFFSKI